MKIKTLTWYSVGGEKFNWLTADDIPQMLYRIRYAGFDKYDLYFYHGYVNKDDVIYNGELEDCKAFAQKHFEEYITNGFLVSK
jgi:hypothetical protein